jgi:hypothetical protein
MHKMSDLSVLLHVLTDIPLLMGVETFVTFILQFLVFLSQPIMCNIPACFLTKKLFERKIH